MSEEGPAYRTIREWAGDERPRERLLAHGPSALSHSELIAIVLRSGVAGENVVDMARKILDDHGGLSGLMRADLKALQRTRGLGPAKAAQLAAAIELGRRAQLSEPAERQLLTRPETIFDVLAPRLRGKTREEFYVLALDTKGRLLGAISPLNGGSVNAVQVRPSETFKEAIILDATSVVLVHNHPSGDPRPSPQDIAVTKALIAAGKLLDIEVVDHVVIGATGFVSMKREAMAFERRT